MIKLTDSVEIFRFQVGKAAYIAWAAAPSVIVFLVVIAILRHQLDRQAAVFFSVCLSWYIVLGSMSVMQNATLTLDPSGVEKLALNIRLRRLDWRSVGRIRQFALYSRASGKTVIWTKVDPTNGPIWSCAIFSSITFPSRTDDFPRLIRMMNTYASQHKIEIKKKINGAWVQSATLSDQIHDLE